MTLQFPEAQATYLAADYTRPLELPPLDGIVMANSLHFQRAKRRRPVARTRLSQRGGHLLLVEYNADHGNMWVPYPLSYPTWEKLAGANGLVTPAPTTTPSRFLREIYSARA